MQYQDHVNAAEREAATIVATLHAGPMDAPVPTCPDWTLQDLTTHLAEFCGWWTGVLCEGTGAAKPDFPQPGPDERRPEWFASWFGEQAALVVEHLRRAEVDTKVWTWDPSNPTAAFVARRVAHELAIHRFDAQAARSTMEPIEPALANDGIEEIFTMIAARRAAGREGGAGMGETLLLRASDTGGVWTITLTPDGTLVDRQTSTSDLAVRGPVSDLELLLYQRPPLAKMESVGEYTVLEAWRRAFPF